MIIRRANIQQQQLLHTGKMKNNNSNINNGSSSSNSGTYIHVCCCYSLSISKVLLLLLFRAFTRAFLFEFQLKCALLLLYYFFSVFFFFFWCFRVCLFIRSIYIMCRTAHSTASIKSHCDRYLFGIHGLPKKKKKNPKRWEVLSVRLISSNKF